MGVWVGDVNHDGIVNSQDIALISSNWQATSGGSGSASAAVPEPSAAMLALLAVLVAGCQIRRRRSHLHAAQQEVIDAR